MLDLTATTCTALPTRSCIALGVDQKTLEKT